MRAGLFDTAVTLCQTFKLPLTPIFEGLTFKYVANFSCLRWRMAVGACAAWCLAGRSSPGSEASTVPTCLLAVAAHSLSSCWLRGFEVEFALHI